MTDADRILILSELLHIQESVEAIRKRLMIEDKPKGTKVKVRKVTAKRKTTFNKDVQIFSR